MKYAVLLHIVDWQIPDASSVDLGDGVQICEFEGSSVQQIYESLCSDYGLDGGEPFSYGSYFLVERQRGRLTFDICDVQNDVARLCNLVAICFGSPVGMSRVLQLTDSLEYSGISEMAHDYTAATEFLQSLKMEVTPESRETIKQLWCSVAKLRDNYQSYRRLNMALIYFNYSWRGFNLDQVCVNLAIVLEALFSPSSNTELAHQISYNTCCFLANDADERSRVYSIIKRFYGLRSKIVHGDWPDDERLSDLTPDVFVLCAHILRRILGDPTWLRKFSSNKERLDMFRQWLFK